MPLDAARLRATIESVTDLPTLPVVVSKITSQIANPTTNAADIGSLIEQDQVLTGKVLRLVNSAYYGFPKQIKSIQHAVVILGFNKVKTIIITASVFSAFGNRKPGALDLQRFWQHSLASALASKAAAELIGVSHVGEDAFVGGLLHDIGKVVMDQYQPNIYAPIVKYACDKGILLLDAEREVMGLDHALVGGWMTEKWRLPPAIVHMVSDHHLPNATTERRDLIASIHLGDILARAMGIGYGGDNRMPEIDPAVAGSYGIDARFFDEAVDRLVDETMKAEDFFSLIASGTGEVSS
ncbi:MAG: HDOD domain-containing protein [Planctomycetota bacterium]|jgi:putative nucleotidyltransferase with HDIG domain|nr:HDOD domain-containing protein [Planctomycetota bacterium]